MYLMPLNGIFKNGYNGKFIMFTITLKKGHISGAHEGPAKSGVGEGEMSSHCKVMNETDLTADHLGNVCENSKPWDTAVSREAKGV